ncbi:TMhelix containing protein [Vibrio phage 1.247.A._10N.261.54.E12]|nr:TMhelix containing protein [Vibrio phage 1.247.A._10N.261.54.E12]AUR98195.1 TMhelix containing protein [Vibrio phage 1.247.B._10N.261.54.E12]
MNYIIETWTANGSDIEMLWFILFLLACFVVVGLMDYRSKCRINKAVHQAQMERIKRMPITNRRGK